MTSLVTIGIPTYNVGRFIALSIKSVLAQTYTNFELIITDDGSTDNTVDEISKFNDPRIKLIVDGKNHGISYRLNQQIDMARGEYFVRMDGDDIMFPKRVEKQVKYLQEHPDVDVIGSGAVIIDDDNEIIGIRNGSNNFVSEKDYIFRTRFIHPTVTGKTSWFREYKYKERYNGCEDCNLWLRSFNASKFFTLNEPLYFYRDPLEFKISTYLQRKKRGRKMRYEERVCVKNRWFVYQFVIKSFLSSIMACVLHFLNKDLYMIGRRNAVIDRNLDIYEGYLKKYE